MKDDRLISLNAALDAIDANNGILYDSPTLVASLKKMVNALPSAQPERTECFPDTKAIPSQYDCVCLSEKVTATFFDAESEEWTQQTVTIADVLDSVCDDYTVLPSAQPEIVRCKDCRWGRESCGNIECSVDANLPSEFHGYDWFCPNGEREDDERSNFKTGGD